MVTEMHVSTKVITKLDLNICGCRYYSLDAYHKRKMEKEMKKGFKRGPETERTIFNDEEQRRYVWHIHWIWISVSKVPHIFLAF